MTHAAADWSLKYHRIGKRGKLEVVATKFVGTKEDLSVAYSPGVAEPCLAIAKNPDAVYDYTGKGHLIGVVTNGSAVLGLGNIGPLAAKPVMEGKAVLFKACADLDSFDIELAVSNAHPHLLVEVIAALAPTFGGINLEDIAAPDCFMIEREVQARVNIPIFHDDQHGTAIIAGAGLLNALELSGKRIEDVRVVVCGCGAAGFTCATYFPLLGVKRENIVCVDIAGVVYAGRPDVATSYLRAVAVPTDKRTLAEAIVGADVFLGLSAGGLLTKEMLISMAPSPLVFALANPNPEIDPTLARAVRPDVFIATGRSDFPYVPAYGYRSLLARADVCVLSMLRLQEHAEQRAGLCVPMRLDVAACLLALTQAPCCCSSVHLPRRAGLPCALRERRHEAGGDARAGRHGAHQRWAEPRGHDARVWQRVHHSAPHRRAPAGGGVAGRRHGRD